MDAILIATRSDRAGCGRLYKLESKSRCHVQPFNISFDSQNFNFSSARTQSREQWNYPGREEESIRISDIITEEIVNSRCSQKKRISGLRLALSDTRIEFKHIRSFIPQKVCRWRPFAHRSFLSDSQLEKAKDRIVFPQTHLMQFLLIEKVISAIAPLVSIFRADAISPNSNLPQGAQPTISPDPSPTRQVISPTHSISGRVGDALGNEGGDRGNDILSDEELYRMWLGKHARVPHRIA
jgi:hypothetical protein